MASRQCYNEMTLSKDLLYRQSSQKRRVQTFNDFPREAPASLIENWGKGLRFLKDSSQG